MVSRPDPELCARFHPWLPFFPAAEDKSTKAVFVVSNPEQEPQPHLSTCADAQESASFLYLTNHTHTRWVDFLALCVDVLQFKLFSELSTCQNAAMIQTWIKFCFNSRFCLFCHRRSQLCEVTFTPSGDLSNCKVVFGREHADLVYIIITGHMDISDGPFNKSLLRERNVSVLPLQTAVTQYLRPTRGLGGKFRCKQAMSFRLSS